MAMAGPLSLLLFFLSLFSISTVHSSDSSTLRRLIPALLGLPNIPSTPCRTPGITCQTRGGTSLQATRIRLPSSRLTGSIPASIGSLSELRELSLPNNRLTGSLPSEISACTNLEVLNLSNNRLSGEVPLEVASLVRLRSLDLSSNKLSGDLSFLIHFPNLENLSLADNFFSGRIPQSLSSFRNLVFLDLSSNPDLHGEIPRLESSVDQVRRKRRGRLVPARYMLAETSSNSTKNNSTTTRVRNRNQTSSIYAPAPSPMHSVVSDEHKNRHKLRNWMIGFVLGSLGGIVSGLCMSVVFRMILNFIRGRYKNVAGPAIFSSIIKKADDLAFLQKDDFLASLPIIGRGGCGEVYKAELPSNPGKMIAIKKIVKRSLEGNPSEDESKQLDKWMKQIRSEILTVGHIRHRNLLPLLAHTTRPDCHFLIYEFMKNGSLHDALKRAQEGNGELDWLTRHKIARGIAKGLEYLHIHHKPHIIHRDLKPANILLDDDMEARITDFGLAKEMPDANTHMTSSNVAGTVGYIAQEYHQTLKFTEKCDIYSFGVILAVLVMGRFPSDDFFQETDEMSLVVWMRNVLVSGNPIRAIDPNLVGNGYEEQMLLVLKIAGFCTADDPKDRPNSKDVRLMLSQIMH